MFILYLVKTSNDFYDIRYNIKYTRHRTLLSQACGQKVVPTWIRLTIKSGLSCRCLSIAGHIPDVADLKRRLTVAWFDCCSTYAMKSTRQLTSGVDGCVPVWEFMSTIWTFALIISWTALLRITLNVTWSQKISTASCRSYANFTSTFCFWGILGDLFSRLPGRSA